MKKYKTVIGLFLIMLLFSGISLQVGANGGGTSLPEPESTAGMPEESEGEEGSDSNVPNASREKPESTAEMPEESEGEEEGGDMPEESEGEDDGDMPKESREKPEGTAEIPEGSDGEDGTPDTPEESGGEDSAADTSEESGSKESGKQNVIMLAACIAGAAAAVIAVLSVIWVVIHRKKAGSEPRKTGEGIPLRLEVYAGKCRNKSSVLQLHDCLTVGSASDCDIVFEDPDVADRNSRIRIKDGQLYIEDLNSPRGTALDGMRFQGQNRLRGGEVISIGSVEFSIFMENEA